MPATASLSVRDQLAEIDAEIRDTDLSPRRAAELIVRLSVLLGNVLTEVREAEHAYNLVLLKCYETETKANRAKIKAETSLEHVRQCEARDLEKWVNTMVGSLKYLQRAVEKELELAR